MRPPLQVMEAAARFWSAVSLAESFPRDVRRAVARTQPVFIVMLPALHVAAVEAWLRRLGPGIHTGVDDRPLHACLVAHGGTGFIFVDGDDAENEQRYSIAHELGHFLHDYLAPRQAAVARHRDTILDVLDGFRPPDFEERAVALLAHATIGQHVHFMERRDNDARRHVIDRAEAIADALALELLAPWALLADQIAELGIAQERADVARLLTEDYGLPSAPAWRYAHQLCPRPEPVSPLLSFVRDVEHSKVARNRR